MHQLYRTRLSRDDEWMNNCNTSCQLPINSPQKLLHGDTWRATITFRQIPDGATDPILLDLTGYSELHACIYSKQPANELGVIEATFPDPASGVVKLVLAGDSEFFQNNPPATYQWQFSMKDLAGDRKTYISASTFEVRPNE